MDKTLASAPIFDGLDPGAVAAMRKQLRPINFSPGHVVFTEGEPGEALYIIRSGKVKIGRRGSDGRHHLLMVLGSSDIFGELSLFDPGPRTSGAVAITKVRAVWLDRAGLRAWLVERPEIAEQLLRVLARRLRRTNDAVADQIFTDVPGRVAKQLLLLGERFGIRHGDELRVNHDLTQEEIGQLAGASRETTHKALHGFAARGWIRLESSSVVILNPESLARRARYQPPG